MHAPRAPSSPVPAEPGPGRPPGWRRWQSERWASFGLSPTFRAYLFVGSILAVLAFLLYSESIIRQVRDQEKSNVALYAMLISLAPVASDEQQVAIFRDVITHIDFPIIQTDHAGRIKAWNGVDLHALADTGSALTRAWRAAFRWRRADDAARGDTTAAQAAALQRLMARMDAINDPIRFYEFRHVRGYLYWDGERAVITDGEGELVEWAGPDLGTSMDTSAAVRGRAEACLARMRGTVEAVGFQAPVDSLSHLYLDGRNAIVAGWRNEALAWRGPDLPAPADSTAAARRALTRSLRAMGDRVAPVSFQIPAATYIHYGESALVSRISRATFVQIGVLVLFVLVGYVGLRNIKRSEQRSIWVGMAKETAHQLGTPLSSLFGWLELMEQEIRTCRDAAAGPAGERLARTEEMVTRMHQDLQRLSRIASRFSQIGSTPDLHPGDVVGLLEDSIAYFRQRVSQFGQHQIGLTLGEPVPRVPLNAVLLEWVFENLFKNAIDAIDHGSGVVEVTVGVAPEGGAVRITFRDNGRGIQPADTGRVFDPGFSTKKRGWGLGLAFARRIVEEYHGGHIGVVQSVPGEGTTFEILLPLSPRRG